MSNAFATDPDDVLSVCIRVYRFTLIEGIAEINNNIKHFCPFFSYIKKTDTFESIVSRLETIAGDSLGPGKIRLALLMEKKAFFLTPTTLASPTNAAVAAAAAIEGDSTAVEPTEAEDRASSAVSNGEIDI